MSARASCASVAAGRRSATSEIVLATLGSIGLLTAPIIAWARFVIDQVWPSTPRTLDVLGRGKRVLATSLVTYAMGMLLVRLFDGAFHAIPVVSPGRVGG